LLDSRSLGGDLNEYLEPGGGIFIVEYVGHSGLFKLSVGGNYSMKNSRATERFCCQGLPM